MSYRVKHLLPAMLLLLCSGAAHPQQSGEQSPTSDSPSAQSVPRPVKLVEVAPNRRAFERTFFGQVIAPQTVDLAFQVGGRLQQLPIIEGQEIAQGDLVAQLDLDPFERGLERARVELAQAQRNADRTANLRSSNSVSRVEAEDTQSALELAQLAYDDAQKALEDASLHAPFDAIVSARNASNFSTVAAGTSIARLLDLHELWINVHVPEILFRQQSGASPEDLEMFAVFPGSDTRYALEFREFNAETSTVGQTYELTLGMAQPEDQRVLPGASAMVTIRLLQGDRDIVLPASALFGDSEHDLAVMVFEQAGDEDHGTVRRQKVNATPLVSGTDFIVTNLDIGTLVVAAGASLLDEGQRVRRFQGFDE